MSRIQGQRDRRQIRRDRREAAADRRIGHDMAYVYESSRLVLAAVAVVLPLAGGWWIWTHVDHDRIAAVSAVLGGGLLLASLLWFIGTGSNRVRMMRLARGQTTPTLPWVFVGVAGMLLLAAAAAIWGQGL